MRKSTSFHLDQITSQPKEDLRMNGHLLSTDTVTVPWREGPLLAPESARLFRREINLIQGRKENELKAVK